MTASLGRVCSWSVPQLRWSNVRAIMVVCAQADDPTTKSFARAVRPVKIKLITVAKGNSKGAEAVAREWTDKVKRYTQLEHLQVKPNPKKAASPIVAVQSEGEKVLKLITPQDYVVLLDENGKAASSEGMAKLVAEAGERGVANLVFCIGGPYGHSMDVRSRANETLKLSDMVLNHQIAHMVLLEQIYRAWTILRGEPYHH
ncbi:TPA: hypothetical protein ACH3X3_009134 [Trebouxia sp. C0006]